jgi:cell division septation protein DedD
MPNLNLKGDAPESGVPAKPASKPANPSGGGSKTLLYVIIAVVIVGAGAYVLNSKGIVHLWGKKKMSPPAMVETPVAPAVDTANAASAQDTAGLVNLKQASLNLGTSVTPGKTKGMMGARSGQGSSAASNIPMSENGSYSVQVSSWESEQKADVEADVFKRVGFPAFVEEKHVAGEGTRYRVYIGKYDTDRDAHSSGQKMLPMLESGYLVVRLSK